MAEEKKVPETPEIKKKEKAKNPSFAAKYQKKENETRYDARKRVRQERELKEQKAKRNAILGIVGIVAAIVVVIVAINVTKIANAANYFKINDEKISEAEYNYYFTSTYNSYAQLYASYMGLDTTASLSSQMYDENYTFQDTFDRQTVNTIIYYHALHADAEANGFTCDVTEDLNSTLEEYTTYATENGMTLDELLQNYYGVTQDEMKGYLEYQLFVEKYETSLKEQYIADGMSEDDAATKLSEYETELIDKYTVSDPKGHLNYLLVDAQLEAAQTDSSSEVESSSDSEITESDSSSAE